MLSSLVVSGRCVLSIVHATQEQPLCLHCEHYLMNKDYGQREQNVHSGHLRVTNWQCDDIKPWLHPNRTMWRYHGLLLIWLCNIKSGSSVWIRPGVLLWITTEPHVSYIVDPAEWALYAWRRMFQLNMSALTRVYIGLSLALTCDLCLKIIWIILTEKLQLIHQLLTVNVQYYTILQLKPTN